MAGSMTRWRSATWLALLVPAAAYLAFVIRYAVNAVVLDQWQIVALGRAVSRGQLTLSALWTPHNENRMLFSYLVMLAANFADRFNVAADVVISAVLLVVATGLLAWLVARTSSRAWLAAVPAAFVVLSPNQFATSLSGFAVALYMVLVCLVGSLALLYASERRTWTHWPALLLAVVGSYSSAQGLGIWAAGLVFLLARGQRGPRLWVWLGAAVATAVVYVFGLPGSAAGSAPTWVLSHPGQGLAFLALLVGSAIPPAARLNLNATALAAIGGVILAVSLGMLASAGAGRVAWRRMSLPLALISFGLAVDVLVAVGRADLGFTYAASPRYIWVNLWLLAGVWIGAVELIRRPALKPAQAVVAVVGVLVLTQVVLGYRAGLIGGGQARSRSLEAATLTLRFEHASGPEVARVVGVPVAEFKPLSRYLRRRGLAVFSH